MQLYGSGFLGGCKFLDERDRHRRGVLQLLGSAGEGIHASGGWEQGAVYCFSIVVVDVWTLAGGCLLRGACLGAL